MTLHHFFVCSARYPAPVSLRKKEQTRCALTGLGSSLRSNVPGSLRAIVITIGEIHYQAFGALLHTVKTGSPAFTRRFGASLFEQLPNNTQGSAAFNKGLSDLSSLLVHAVLFAYDFSEISSVVDGGGGEGLLLRRILDLYPEMTGVAFDSSNELRSPASPSDTADRCSFASGNFFDSIPERADAYLLCGVIHDWNDERAAVILRNCREAMPKNGRLLIIETIVPETDSASFSKLLDINMMVMDIFTSLGFHVTVGMAVVGEENASDLADSRCRVCKKCRAGSLQTPATVLRGARRAKRHHTTLPQRAELVET